MSFFDNVKEGAKNIGEKVSGAAKTAWTLPKSIMATQTARPIIEAKSILFISPHLHWAQKYPFYTILLNFSPLVYLLL